MATTTERHRAAPREHGGNPVWRKAPASLLRHPSLFAALSLGAFLVVVSTVAYPLFLSASGSALVSSAIDDPTVTRFGAGIIYTSTNVRFDKASPDGHGLLSDRRREVFSQTVGTNPSVGPVIEQAMGSEIAVTGPGGQVPSSGPVNGVLFFGTDVLDHVDLVEGTDGTGVWLPDYVAEPLDAHPGDRVELRSGTAVVPVTVDGIYRALYALPSTGYWRTWSEQLYIPCTDCTVPPQPILVDRDQLIALSNQLGMERASFALSAPVRADPPLRLDEARGLGSFADRLSDELTFGRSPLRSLFPCCGQLYVGTGHSAQFELLGAMSRVVKVVDQRIAAVQGPIQVLFLAGLLISFVVVAAAGMFSFTARRVDGGVLAVRGWGPGSVGVKAVLESVLPCVVGAIIGFVVATGLIAWIGPQGSIDPAARASALVGSIVATLGVLAVVGVVSALTFVSHHEPRQGLSRVAFIVPWEILALGGAYVAAGRLHARGGILGSTVQRPAPTVFLFPLLLALGVAILVARLMILALSRRRRGDRTHVSAWYLAVRRLASSSRLTMVFLVAATLTLAVFAASQTMVSSLRSTVDAKAKVFVGSDVQLQIRPDTQIPSDLGFPATIATRSKEAGSIPGSDREFDLLAIDPATFEAAAYWNSAFSDRSEADLLRLLDTPSGDRLPVVLAYGQGIAPAAIEIQQHIVPIDIVATASGVPGTSSTKPVFVVARDRLYDAFAGLGDPLNEVQATREMWIRGPTDQVLAAAARRGRVHLPDDHRRRGVGHPVHQSGDRHVHRAGSARHRRVDPGARRGDRVHASSTTLARRVDGAVGEDGAVGGRAAAFRGPRAVGGVVRCARCRRDGGHDRCGIRNPVPRSAAHDPAGSHLGASVGRGRRCGRWAGGHRDRGWMALDPRRARRSTGGGASCRGLRERPSAATGSSVSIGLRPARFTRCMTSRACSRRASSPRSSAHRGAASLRCSG